MGKKRDGYDKMSFSGKKPEVIKENHPKFQLIRDVAEWIHKDWSASIKLYNECTFHESPLAFGIPKKLYNKLSSDAVDQINTYFSSCYGRGNTRKPSVHQIISNLLEGW